MAMMNVSGCKKRTRRDSLTERRLLHVTSNRKREAPMTREEITSVEPNPARASERLADARHLLDAAYDLERGLDFPAALSRARQAGQLALALTSRGGAELREDVGVAIEEFDARDRAWRRSVEARKAIYDAREVAAA
jgi:hypothetical protein